MSSTITDFDLGADLPARGWHLLEASAGTGKTYSLTALVARYIAEEGLLPEQLLMVTFTRAAAAEMKHEVRQQLVDVLAALEAVGSTASTEWLAAFCTCDDEVRATRISRLRAAISTIDSATITTLHGFFQQALADLGIRAGETGMGVSPQADSAVRARVVRDELVARFAREPNAFGRTAKRTPAIIEAEIVSTLGAVSGNAGAIIAPAADTASYATDLAAFIVELEDRERRARAELGVVDFDDIIRRLVELLDDPELGEAIASSLLSRYRLVLIDEFQDTDTEQWKLFTTVFDPARVGEDFLALIAVGDPKQAIYRFRGADIEAYLAAASDPRMTRWRLADNHRTDRPLVEALNSWLDGVEFGSDRIAYQRVGTPDRNAELRLEGGGAPLQFRHLPEVADRNMAAYRRAIAVDVVDHIGDLLSSGRIRVGNGPDASTRPVEHRDICILVRGHNDAMPVLSELRARGIPAVQSRIGSVLESDAVAQLRILLTAMATPGDARRVRALELSWFAARPEVDPSATAADEQLRREKRTRELQAWSSAQADVLFTRGPVGWFQSLRIHPEVIAGIADGPDALRRLTDLEHLIELINADLGGRRAPAGVVLHALDELVGTANGDSDEQKRRIDTDHDVVQITSMHSAKGLEYPIVLLPYAKDINASSQSIYVVDGARQIDCAPSDPWVIGVLDQDTRKALDAREVVGDELRLLYVALTRAKHQLVVWWGRPAKAGRTELFNGSLGRVLFGDTTDLDSATPVLLDGEVADRFRSLAERLEVAEYRQVDTWDARRSPRGRPTVGGHLRSAEFPSHPIDRDHWYRWSYTSISKGVRGDDEGDPRGGLDEHDDATGAGGGPTFHGDLVGITGSNVFGTWVHELMERLEFSDASIESIRDAVVADGRAAAFAVPGEEVDGVIDHVARGLLGVIDTPLDPLGVTLRDIDRSDRLAEMEFHFPLGLESAVAIPALFDLAAGFDTPFQEYFSELASGERLLEVRGLLTGSIDAVLRLHDGPGQCFSVVDYKTNRLHPIAPGSFDAPLAAYGEASMRRAMEHGDYPLQVLVYCVAAHRLLSTRLPDYDIDTHLGPTLYLFVRGMVGAETAVDGTTRNGVFSWRPPSEMIVAASRILGGRS